MAVFLDTTGNTTHTGINGEYNQVDYDAPLSEFAIYRNNDGSVTVSHPTIGTDTLINIDGLWSDADQSWYSIEDAISLTPNSSQGGSPQNSSPQPNDIGVFLNLDGDQTFTGSSNDYNQVDYDGHLSDYSISRNNDGSVTVSHPTLGTDTLVHIDGLWLDGDQSWYSIDDAINLTNDAGQPNIPVPVPDPEPNPTNPEADTDFQLDDFGVLRGTNANDVLTDTDAIHSLYGGLGNDTLNGTAGEYSQAEYDGFAAEYTFTQNANGSVTVTHPVWGTDTLTDIDGFWFQDEQAWYPIEDLVTGETDTPNQPDPQPDPEPQPEPEGPDTGTTIDGVITGSNDVNDFLNGTGGNDTFFAGRGTDVINGGAGNDTLNVDGDIFEWTFSANADGSVTMTHPTWGENTLIGIENIFSQRSGQSFTIDDAIASTDGLPRFRLDNDNVINGTNGDDNIQATADVQGFYGGTGDDVYFGTDNFEQVNYDGSRSEYNITQNNDGSITVDHPIWGTDTLNDIDALIFTGVEPGVGGAQSGPFEFVSTDDLFA